MWMEAQEGEARERLPKCCARPEETSLLIGPTTPTPILEDKRHLAGVLASVCTPAGGPTASHCAVHGGLPPPCLCLVPSWEGPGTQSRHPAGTLRLGSAPVLPCLHHQSGEQLFLHPEPRSPSEQVGLIHLPQL